MKSSKASSQARDTKVIAGLGAHFTGASVFQFDGVEYKAKEIQRILQSRIDAASVTSSARATWLTAAADEQEKTNVVDAILVGLRSHLVTAYGAKSQIVADFGFTPKKKEITAETVAAAVKKRAATRQARGTVGKKQKLKIKGVVAPETSATASETSAAPETNGTTPPATTSN